MLTFWSRCRPLLDTEAHYTNHLLTQPLLKNQQGTSFKTITLHAEGAARAGFVPTEGSSNVDECFEL